MRKNLRFIFILCTLCMCSCEKFLAEKPNKKLIIPTKLSDLQQLLNNPLLYGAGPNIPEILSDDYYITNASWNALSDERIRNLYLWKQEEYDNWDIMYRAIYHANVVLDHLDMVEYDSEKDRVAYEQIKGTALFLRAFYYYWILEVYTLPYDDKVKDRLGIPIRNNADFNKPSKRESLAVNYQQVLLDLKEAVELLPQTTEVKTQPSKSAARGLLARVYLEMHDYLQSFRYADTCISDVGIQSLLDFNVKEDFNPQADRPFKVMNKEVIFHAVGSGNTVINRNNAKVDSVLLMQYAPNDLRKVAFFKENTGQGLGTFHFKGVYDEDVNGIFHGLALDEMMYIRAESAVRTGSVKQALDDINLLGKKRWKNDTYNPLVSDDADEILRFVLQDRRKGLLRRGLRWADLRRLARYPAFRSTPTRLINGEYYKLDTEGPRMNILIPNKVIQLTGMPQNQ